jgi:hypothetical protein
VCACANSNLEVWINASYLWFILIEWPSEALIDEAAMWANTRFKEVKVKMRKTFPYRLAAFLGLYDGTWGPCARVLASKGRKVDSMGLRELPEANLKRLLLRRMAMVCTRGSHFLERPLHDFFWKCFRHLGPGRCLYQLKLRTCVIIKRRHG